MLSVSSLTSCRHGCDFRAHLCTSQRAALGRRCQWLPVSYRRLERLLALPGQAPAVVAAVGRRAAPSFPNAERICAGRTGLSGGPNSHAGLPESRTKRQTPSSTAQT